MVEVAPVTSITANIKCPTFSQALQLLPLIFSPLTEVKGHYFFLFERNVISNNSKLFFVCCLFSAQCDFCWCYFCDTGIHILSSYLIMHPSSRHPRADLVCLCDFVALPHMAVCAQTDFFPLFQAQ